MEHRISYAQNREDLIIAGFFPDVTAGHYIDVGAGHPRELSVTKRFYDAGWSGINIEPIPELAALLAEERPRDVTLQMALSSAVGTASFRQYAGSGLSTLNSDIVEENEQNPSAVTAEHVDYEVTLTTLAAVFAEHPLPHVHFLKIDVEGSEYDVIDGNDWEQLRPELLCIETDHITRDWRPLLAAARYREVFHDGLNAYFLAEESIVRAERFNFASAVLDGPVLVTPDVGAHLDLVPDLWAKVKHLTDVNARFAERTANLSGQVQQLTSDVEIREAALAAEKSVSALYAAREAEVTARLNSTQAFLAEILDSQSWRYTKPIRRSVEILKARLPRRLLALVWRRFRPPVRAARTPISDVGELSPDAAILLDRMQTQADIGRHE